MFKHTSILAIILAGLIAGCSSSKEVVEKPVPYLTTTKIDVGNVLKVMEIVNPTATNTQGDSEEVTKIADSIGGIEKNVDLELTKDIYLVYAGLNNKFNLKASKPTAIITSAGGENSFTVTKTQPFEGDVVFITYVGSSNKYDGARQMTFDEFRKAAQGLK